MKRITGYLRLDQGEVVLEDGSRWTVPGNRQIEVTFWKWRDPVECDDYEPGGYLRRLGSAGRIPARQVAPPGTPHDPEWDGD